MGMVSATMSRVPRGADEMALLAQGPFPVPGKLVARARRAAWLWNDGVSFRSVRAMLYMDRRGGRDAEENKPDVKGQLLSASLTRGP